MNAHIPQNIPMPKTSTIKFGQRNQIVLAAQMMALARAEGQRGQIPNSKRKSNRIGLARKILALLETNGKTKQSDIARILGCNITSVQYNVKRLAANGEIIRTTNRRGWVSYDLAAR